RLGVALAQDITDIAFEGGAVTVIHPVYAGKALLKLKLTATPAVVSLRPNVFTPVQRPKAGTAEIVAVDAAAGRVVVTGVKATAAGPADPPGRLLRRGRSDGVGCADRRSRARGPGSGDRAGASRPAGRHGPQHRCAREGRGARRALPLRRSGQSTGVPRAVPRA